MLLVWTDGKRKVPLGIKVWRKGGVSKVKLAGQLLRKGCLRGVSPEFVLFDSWYSAALFLELIDGVKIGKVFRHRFGRKVGSLRKLRHQILLVKDGTKFLMTNKVSLVRKLSWGEKQFLNERHIPTCSQLINKSVIKNHTTNNSRKLQIEIQKSLQRIKRNLR